MKADERDAQDDFARRFRAVLSAKGYETSARAAAALGVSRSYLGPIWLGERSPRIASAEVLLRKVGSSLAELYAMELADETAVEPKRVVEPKGSAKGG